MAKKKSGSFDQLLAAVWEKIVLGVAVLITLGLIVMSFMSTPKVDVTPEQLTQLASRAEQNYKSTPPQPTRDVPGFAEVAKRIRESVSSTGYQIVVPFDPPLFEQRRKRGQPTVYPVTDLRAAAGHGAVAGLAGGSAGTPTGYPGTGYPGSTGYPGTSGPPGMMTTMPETYGEEGPGYSGYSGYAGYGGGPTGPSHGRRWVVVTGIIEWEKQVRAFRDAFQDAIRVNRGTTGTATTTGYPGSAGYPGYPGYSEYGSSGEEIGYPGSTGYPTAGSGMPGALDIELPQYVYFSIERAEVTDDSAPPDTLKWEPLNARARWFEEQRVPHDQFMYVSPEYVMPPGQVPFTWPLVQLTAGDTWGKEVAHEPDIPFLAPRRTLGYGYGPYASMGGYPGEVGSVGMMGPGSPAGPAGPAGPIPASLAPGQTQQPGGTAGAQPAQPPAPEIPDAPLDPTRMATGVPGASPYGTYPGGAYPGSPYPGGTYPGYPTTSGPPGYGSEYESYPGYPTAGSPYPGYAQQRKEAPVKLFRFVDYKVEPNKKYRYRVKLWLANPNYKLPPQVLEDESLAKDAWLLTEWSEPSNVVRVPPDTGVLAGPAKAGRAPFIEPRITVGVTVFQPTRGLTKFFEFPDLVRGTIVDFSADDVKKMNPPKKEKKTSTQYSEYGSSSGPPGLEGLPGMVGSTTSGPPAYATSGPPGYPGYPGTSPTTQQEETPIDYFTRLMIVDLAGGDTLPNKDLAPSKLVVMDPEGNLMLRDELEDEEQYKRFTQAAQPSPYGPYATGPGEESMYPEEYSEYYEQEYGPARGRTSRTGTTRGTRGTTSRGPAGSRGGPRGSPSGPPGYTPGP
ncbi:MAG: hypothetical protein H5U08_14530 [Thermogutta sp.]|uniref:hypothetical protein n=1 Tax=Thermogutta sp. TaxID=1962930 RepID=UPI0019A9E1F3|nr:hypothetical protein [Thermogutta sp.]MBC7353574.1 hypothetical protein [Thermogutta sp.]